MKPYKAKTYYMAIYSNVTRLPSSAAITALWSGPEQIEEKKRQSHLGDI